MIPQTFLHRCQIAALHMIQMLLGASWNRPWLAPTSRSVSPRSWCRTTLTPPWLTSSAVSLRLCAVFNQSAHSLRHSSFWRKKKKAEGLIFVFFRPRHWERLHEEVSDDSELFCWIDRRSVCSEVLTLVCANLQRHPLEPARREEDDWRHQLAAQSSPDHNLEPCLYGDSCISNLLLCIILVVLRWI